MESKPEQVASTPETQSVPPATHTESPVGQAAPPQILEQPQPNPQLVPSALPQPSVPPKPKVSPKRPVLALVLSTVVFAGLVVAAYCAYLKSK